MPFHKVLCGVDFSPGSERALQAAIRVARRDGAALVIAHAWYVPAAAYTGDPVLIPPTYVQSVVDEARQQLAAAVAEAAARGVAATPLLANGAPEDELVQILRDDAAIDLAVVGTHGRTGLRRVLLGSVAEAVVRRAPCSVLVERAAAPTDAPRILVPTDLTEASQGAAGVAAALAEPDGAGLTLLHVVELQPAHATVAAELDQRATHLLEQQAEQLARHTRTPIRTRTRTGRVGAEILGALDDEPYAMVVMASAGRKRLLRLGSTSEQVVRHAPCSVLVVRHPAP